MIIMNNSNILENVVSVNLFKYNKILKLNETKCT